MVSEKTVNRVAEVARLKLTPEEVKSMEKELSSILKAFRILGRSPSSAKPTFQPIELKNVTRKDIVESSLTQEEALANTQHKMKGFFIGPRVV